jgi:5'-nucleotidase / UDP-sugar diphosphatase
MNIRKQLYVFLLCLLTYAMNMAEGAEEGKVHFRLTVLHNDDAESQLIDAGPGLEDFGGVARFATMAGKLRTDALRGPGIRSKRGVILLTAGDNIFAGAQFNASLAKGIPFYEAIAMENIGYSVSGLGNHDFDFGPDVLADFIAGFHSLPFVSANLDFQNEPRLQALASTGRLARSVVVKVEGEEIGIIGAITPRLPILATPRNVIVNSNLVEVVESEIERLQGEGVKIIILMTHLETLDEAKDLIGQLRGIDIVVAAGSERSNELQANPGDLLIPGDVAFAPYPLLVDDADGQKVPLVSTTGNYRYIGQLTVSFDKQGNLIAVDETRSRPFRVAGGNHPDAVQPDNKLQKKVVEPVRAAVNALASNVIATSEVDLDGLETHVRTVETNEGNLVADALLVEAGRLAPEFGAPAPDVAIVNGGAIRNDSIIPAGTISELDTFNIAPFPNLLAIVPNISPGQFKEIVENAVSQVKFLDGRFAQVSGFRFSWDPAGIPQVLDENGNVVTPGTRIREVSLNDGRVIVTGGAVVMGAPSVTIAVTNFLATGGDQYPFRGTPFANLGISYQQALFNYIVNSLGGFISAADYPESGEGRILKLQL